jgi:phenylacetate-CoA ligase
VNGRLLCSGYSGLPLIRYDLKDIGGIYTLSDVYNLFRSEGVDLDKEISKFRIKSTIWNLPFVYVYERSDFVVKLYGANIFPDSIRRVLLKRKFEKDLTGKFTMVIKYDKNQNQYLEVNVELKSKVVSSSDLKESIQREIIHRLLNENSEYQSNYKSDPLRQMPRIVFWPYEHADYFKPGVKQRWIQKD